MLQSTTRISFAASRAASRAAAHSNRATRVGAHQRRCILAAAASRATTHSHFGINKHTFRVVHLCERRISVGSFAASISDCRAVVSVSGRQLRCRRQSQKCNRQHQRQHRQLSHIDGNSDSVMCSRATAVKTKSLTIPATAFCTARSSSQYLPSCSPNLKQHRRHFTSGLQRSAVTPATHLHIAHSACL
jgi:hypothetical protein